MANQEVPILLHGFFASSNYYTNNNRYGPPIYLDTTAGSATTTVPATSGNVVRILGHVYNYSNGASATVIRFNPDNFWLVV
jgi:hypothetical protein